MMFKEYRFDEVTINFDKKRIPLSGAQREKRQGKYRYFGAQGVIDHIDDYIFDGTYLLIAEDGENLKSKKQNIAQVVDGQFWVNNHAHIVQGNDLCDTRYLCYLLNSMDLSGYVTGSAQPKLSQANLNGVTLLLPSLKEQKCIVEYLYMIDRKIEVNRSINDNLQQQAFAMFDRILSVEHSDSCLLSDVARLNPTRILSKGDHARCIDMAQLSTSGSFPNGWEIKTYNGGRRFTNGDTLFARITPCLENGKTAFVDFLDEGEIAFGSTEYVVMCSQGEYPAEFFYCLARYPAFIDYAVKNMNGSSGRQRVSAETIGKFILPRLSGDEIAEFTAVVSTLFAYMKHNSLENIRLAQLRDALLPKLMSGEIDVSDIQL